MTVPVGRGGDDQPEGLAPQPPLVEEGGTDEQGGPPTARASPAGPAPSKGRRSRLVRDNLSVAAGTALSRVTGVVRLGALYIAVEASLRDAYLLANNTPNIIYELILGGVLTATLVPLFTTHLEHADEEATSAVVSVAGLGLIAVTAVTFAVAPLLIALYGTNPAPGVDPDTLRSVGINLAFLFAPQVLFYGLMAIGSSLLNARRRFFAAAWAPVLNNVVVTAMLLSVPLVIDGDRTLARAADDRSLRLLLGLGTTAGIATMALALWPALRRAGVRIRFRPDWRHPSVRRALTLSGWTIGYVIANQVAAQVVNVLAEPGSGDVSNYQVAFMFFQLPHGLLAVSLMTTFQPDLARAIARHDPETFNRRLLLGLRLLGLVIVPAAIGYFVLPRGFAAGAVDTGLIGGGTDAAGIARILSGFALGLIGFSAYLFVLRGFYALGDTRTPFLLNCGENAVNIVVAVVLVGRYGVEGLAWSYAIAYSVAAVVALGVLLRRVPGFDLRGLVDSYLRLAAAAAVMGVVVAGVMAVAGDTSSTAVVAGSLAAVVVGAAVYAAVVLGLGVPQVAGVRRGRMP